MSVPAQEDGDGPSKDGPLNYAPKKLRHPEPAPDAAGAQSKAGSARPSAPHKRDASDLSESPWRRSRQRRAFAGDVAAVELRNRLALTPDRLPEPPRALSTGPRYSRLAGVVAVAAVGFVGYQLGSAPPRLAPNAGQSEGLTPKRSVPAAYPDPTLDSNSLAGQPGVGRSPQPALTSTATAKEVALPSNEQRFRAAVPRQAGTAAAGGRGRKLDGLGCGCRRERSRGDRPACGRIDAIGRHAGGPEYVASVGGGT
jgi:hypothetical protein